MKFYFHPHADAELDEAIRYYEECQLGLGLDLAEEVYSAIRRASDYPEAWSAMSKNTRRCLVNRFPYGVIFQITNGLIIVATCERVGQAFLPDLVGQEWPTYLGPCRHNYETFSN